MQMSENEIVRNYNAAKKKREQIRILADLNSCSQEEIIKVLTKNGVKVVQPPKKVENADARIAESLEKNGEKSPNQAITDAFPEYFEEPDLTDKEWEQVERACAIPQVVRNALCEKIQSLDEIIKKYKEERDEIEDFLNGVVRNG